MAPVVEITEVFEGWFGRRLGRRGESCSINTRSVRRGCGKTAAKNARGMDVAKRRRSVARARVQKTECVKTAVLSLPATTPQARPYAEIAGGESGRSRARGLGVDGWGWVAVAAAAAVAVVSRCGFRGGWPGHGWSGHGWSGHGWSGHGHLVGSWVVGSWGGRVVGWSWVYLRNTAPNRPRNRGREARPFVRHTKAPV